MKIIDRLEFALSLVAGKRVLDIGGSRMNPSGTSPFDEQYRRLQEASALYHVADRDPGADIVVDLSNVDEVREKLFPENYDVILCMGTLEHLRNPGIVCDLLASAAHVGRTVFVTVPKSSHLFRFLERFGLGRFWGKCHHLYAFHRHHFEVFTGDNFKGLQVTMFRCVGKRTRLWPVVFALSGGGLNWGLLVRRYDGRNCARRTFFGGAKLKAALLESVMWAVGALAYTACLAFWIFVLLTAYDWLASKGVFL